MGGALSPTDSGSVDSRAGCDEHRYASRLRLFQQHGVGRIWTLSSAVERCLYTALVGGSIPLASTFGAIAQLVARFVRIEEVGSSILPSSTISGAQPERYRTRFVGLAADAAELLRAELMCEGRHGDSPALTRTYDHWKHIRAETGVVRFHDRALYQLKFA